MSEDALARYIDQKMADGDKTPDPPDHETRELVGTIQLAQAALSGPKPSEEAEKQSRERIVNMIQNGPMAAQTQTNGLLAWWQRLTLWFRRHR